MEREQQHIMYLCLPGISFVSSLGAVHIITAVYRPKEPPTNISGHSNHFVMWLPFVLRS